MTEGATRYPLSWPAGWKRCTWRKRSPFGKRVTSAGGGGWKSTELLDISDGLKRLHAELKRLDAKAVILSSNLKLRTDGWPKADQAQPSDPGAAVYFKLKGKDTVLACDRWDRVADNLAAIAAHIEAIRAVERYGVGTLDQAFAGYAALPSSTEDWWIVLGVDRNATLEQVDDAFRQLARTAHPDVGGSHDAMSRLTVARDAARKALA